MRVVTKSILMVYYKDFYSNILLLYGIFFLIYIQFHIFIFISFLVYVLALNIQ